MGECRPCMDKRGARYERPYRSVPRQMRYSTYPIPDETKFRTKRRKCIPVECNSCGPCEVTCPCPPACPEPPSCYSDGQNASGFFYNIRNGFQKFFSRSRKACCEPMKGKAYNYSLSQLRRLEQVLDSLEDEACYLEGLIKQGFGGDCRVSCLTFRCTLNSLMEQTESTKHDLLCAYDCYGPCRDYSEYELICCLLDRVGSLEATLNDQCLQLECLEDEANYYSVGGGKCKPNCRKPCCYPRRNNCVPSCDPKYAKYYRPCEIGCRKPCCAKPVCYENLFRPVCEVNCRKPCCAKYPNKYFDCDQQISPRSNNRGYLRSSLGRTSSVIPVGVMLVKL